MFQTICLVLVVSVFAMVTHPGGCSRNPYVNSSSSRLPPPPPHSSSSRLPLPPPPALLSQLPPPPPPPPPASSSQPQLSKVPETPPISQSWRRPTPKYSLSEPLCSQVVELEWSEFDLTKSELDQTKSELDQTKFELNQTKSELDKTCAYLRDLDSSSELNRTKAELDQTKSELHQTKFELNQTKSELDKTFAYLRDLDSSSELNRTKTELDQTKSELDQTEFELDQTKFELDQTKSELNQTKSELDQTKSELNKMALLSHKNYESACSWNEEADNRGRAFITEQKLLKQAQQKLDRVQQEHMAQMSEPCVVQLKQRHATVSKELALLKDELKACESERARYELRAYESVQALAQKRDELTEHKSENERIVRPRIKE